MLNTNEFNKKYKLNKDLVDKFNLIPDSKKQTIFSIAGKPKKMGAEIAKRFFSNPVVTISFIIFISLLLCAILIPLPGLRAYEPGKRINNSTFVPFLPPSYNHFKTIAADPTNPIYRFYEQLKADPDFAKYYKFFTDTVRITDDTGAAFNMTYDAYALYKVSVLNQALAAAKTAGTVVDDAYVASALANIPELKTLLGTSESGYDIWVTSWYATWKAIWIAIVAASIQTIIGVSIGAYAGFHAGKMQDTVIMRIIDIFTSVPYLVWLLMFVPIIGTSSWSLVLSLVLVGWSDPVGATRLFVITVKDEEYITAAKSIGASTTRQVFVHALPAVLGKIATNFVRKIPNTILSVASLAFLGFFKDQTDTNLGQMLIEATPHVSQNVWILLLPSLILLTLSLSLHFVALGVHDALDPKIMAKAKRGRHA